MVENVCNLTLYLGWIVPVNPDLLSANQNPFLFGMRLEGESYALGRRKGHTQREEEMGGRESGVPQPPVLSPVLVHT